MSTINLENFLDAAFGYHDSESGYGAKYPASRDIQTFFKGRIGTPLMTSGAITTNYKNNVKFIQDPWVETAKALAKDFRDLADQLDAMLTARGGESC